MARTRLLCCWLLFGCLVGLAHVKDLITCKFQVGEKSVQLSLVLPIQLLTSLDDDKDGKISNRESAAHALVIADVLKDKIVLRDGEKIATLTVTTVPGDFEMPELGVMPGSHGVIQLEFAFTEPIKHLTVHYEYFPLPERCVSTFHTRGGVRTFTFDQRLTDFDLEQQEGQFSSYFFMGINHLFTGVDHILFLITLICGSVNLKATIKTVTAFAVAHSLTLALGVLGWIHISPAFVEPVIALSIVYTAVYNLKYPPAGGPWKTAFFFGLIHGLGFATILTEVKLSGWALINALAGFNIGIEAAQIFLVLLFVPLLNGIREMSHGARLVKSISVLTGLMASVWFIERSGTLWRPG